MLPYLPPATNSFSNMPQKMKTLPFSRLLLLIPPTKNETEKFAHFFFCSFSNRSDFLQQHNHLLRPWFPGVPLDTNDPYLFSYTTECWRTHLYFFYGAHCYFAPLDLIPMRMITFWKDVYVCGYYAFFCIWVQLHIVFELSVRTECTNDFFCLSVICFFFLYVDVFYRLCLCVCMFCRVLLAFLLNYNCCIPYLTFTC